MKAREINEHLNSLWDGLKEDTVDRVIYGDPGREVTGIAVSWMPYLDTLKRAREAGANVLVTHEPTFYSHRDLDDPNALKRQEAVDKKRWLDEAEMTVIRCHDVWDAIPDIGIPFAWGDFLGLTALDGQALYYNVYRVAEQTAAEFATYVAGKVRRLGQESVGFYGDPGRKIRTVGVGTGCICQPQTLYDLGADLAISVDDALRSWVGGEMCADTGKPVVVVNHCVSEEPGIVKLADYLEKTFPDVTVTHFPQGCTYQTFG